MTRPAGGRTALLVLFAGFALVCGAEGYGERTSNANERTSTEGHLVSTTLGIATRVMRSFTPSEWFVRHNVTLWVRRNGGGGAGLLNVKVQGETPTASSLRGQSARAGEGWLDFSFAVRATLAAGTTY